MKIQTQTISSRGLLAPVQFTHKVSKENAAKCQTSIIKTFLFVALSLVGLPFPDCPNLTYLLVFESRARGAMHDFPSVPHKLNILSQL